jgi:RHS repeat-associated protein
MNNPKNDMVPFTHWHSWYVPDTDPKDVNHTIELFNHLVTENGSSANENYRVEYDFNGHPIAWVPTTQTNLPTPKASMPQRPVALRPFTEPVFQDGEFVVQETDVRLPGFGIPYTFTRYYRSGVNYQSPLGFGWNHNLGQKIIELESNYENANSCSGSHNDVVYVSAMMDRIRFSYQSTSQDGAVDSYSAGPQVPLHLRKVRHLPATPWALEDGSGLTYLFDDTGRLFSIQDAARHSIRLYYGDEKNGNNLDHVIDTRGITIHYVYQTKSFTYNRRTAPFTVIINGENVTSHDSESSPDPSFVSLQCITLTGDCKDALVSFDTRGLVAFMKISYINQDRIYNNDGTVTLINGFPYFPPNTIEWDLVGVRDAGNHGPVYEYFHNSATEYDREFTDYLPDSDLGTACHGLCDSRELSCHNVDLCRVMIDDQIEAKCGGIADNRQQAAVGYCMASNWNGNTVEYQKTLDDCSAQSQDPILRQRYSQSCYSAVANSWKLNANCRQRCLMNCIGTKGAKDGAGNRRWAYGVPPELYHSLTKVIDADGRTVVENKYGEDPLAPDFAKVITHIQGEGPDNVMTFDYYDLSPQILLDTQPGDLQPVYAPVNQQYVTAASDFKSVEVCPSDGDTGYKPARTLAGPDSVQLPSHAVVVHDIGGVALTDYYDSAWRLLREVNHGARTTTDRNYQAGALHGIRLPAGDRVCLEAGDFAKPVQITRLPAPGARGGAQPEVTQFSYDDAGQLLQEIRDPFGPLPSGTEYRRDEFERVIAKAEQVTPVRANWTCYAYADSDTDSEGIINPDPSRTLPGAEPGVVPGVSGRRPMHARVVSGGGAGMFQPSGCLFSQKPSPATAERRDDIPSTTIKPDGSVVSQSVFSAAGSGDIVVDSSGGDPIETYLTYDSFGRLTDAGRIDHKSGNPKVGTSQHAQYEADGRLSYTAWEDPNTGALVKTAYDYDNSHHITRMTAPMFTREFKVDALGNVASVSDRPNGPEQRSQSAAGKPVVSGPAAPRASCFNRDVHGRLLEKIYPEGNAEKYTYNASGQLREVWKGYESQSLPWASDCSPTSPEEGSPSMQLVASYGYDSGGRLKQIDAGGFDRYITVDGFGRVIDRITPMDFVTIQGQHFYTLARHEIRGYDVFGRVAWEAVWGPSSFSYDKPQELDPSLHAMTEFQYDLLDRVTEINRWCFTESPLRACASGRDTLTKINYDDAHGVVTTTDPEGKTSVTHVDGADRTTRATLAHGTADEQSVAYDYSQGSDTVIVTLSPAPTKTGQLVQTYNYNPHGALARISEGNQELFSQTYDAMGQPDQGINLGGGARQTWFDAYGRLYSESVRTDSQTWAKTLYERDGNDRLRRVFDAAHHATAFTYDGLDNIATVTNGIGTTTYSYLPGTNILSTVQDPAETQRTLGYNTAGQLDYDMVTDGPSLGTQGASTTRKFTYTTSGLVHQGIVKGECTVPEDRDVPSPGGNLIAVRCRSFDVVVTREYDSFGRVISEKNSSVPGGVAHAFSPGRIDTQILQNQGNAPRESITYDNLYRPKQVSFGDHVVAAMVYQNGALGTISRGNKLSDVFQYDGRGRLTGIDVLLNRTVIAGLHEALGFDNVPRERQRVFNGASISTDLFKADEAGRVTAENLGLGGRVLSDSDLTNNDVDKLWDSGKPWSTYTLDGASNWNVRSTSGPPFAAVSATVIDEANRYTDIDTGHGLQTVSYDGAGNMVAFGDQSYVFNGLGNLLNASSGAAKEEFRYDAFGRRFQESDGEKTTLFVWDGSRVAALMPKGHPEKTQIRVGAGIDQTVALVENVGAGPIEYLHAGLDNSTLAATDGSGTLAEGYRYTSQGDVTFVHPRRRGGTTASTIGNRFLFQNQLYDPALGLYSMGARQYSPSLGRFLSPDPVGIAGGTNLYAFVSGATLTRSDPSGLSEKQNAGVSLSGNTLTALGNSFNVSNEARAWLENKVFNPDGSLRNTTMLVPYTGPRHMMMSDIINNPTTPLPFWGGFFAGTTVGLVADYYSGGAAAGLLGLPFMTHYNTEIWDRLSDFERGVEFGAYMASMTGPTTPRYAPTNETIVLTNGTSRAGGSALARAVSNGLAEVYPDLETIANEIRAGMPPGADGFHTLAVGRFEDGSLRVTISGGVFHGETLRLAEELGVEPWVPAANVESLNVHAEHQLFAMSTPQNRLLELAPTRLYCEACQVLGSQLGFVPDGGLRLKLAIPMRPLP